MKGLLSFLVSASLLLSLAPVIGEKAFAQENLILNPSVETVNGSNPNLPSNWQHGSVWGDLDVNFGYSTVGHSGNRSLKVEVTRFNSGDAKWRFDPVTVNDEEAYTFSDYYRSNVGSEIVVEQRLSNGSTSYKWLAWAQPSSDWRLAEIQYSPDPNTESVTVLHLLLSQGYLETDSFSLAGEKTPPPPPQGIIDNPGVEIQDPINPALPRSWSSSSWGTNTSTYSYLNEGYQSNRSVKVSISNYQNGDAKWYFNPISIQPSTRYTFSNYYKSNTDSRVVAWITTSAGTNSYLELRGASASTTWSQYSDSFVTPANAQLISVFHLISSNGTLTIDNVNLIPSIASGFNRGLLTLTFDDGWEKNYQTALPLMQQFGFVSTQFYATQFINPGNQTHLSRINQFINAGHEIGSHTVTHPDLTTLSPRKLANELDQSKRFLENTFNIQVNNFASPFGAYNQTVINAISARYRSHRTVDAGYNSKDNFDIYRLKVQNILITTTASEVEQWVSQSKQDKTWLILVYHRIDTENLGTYDTTPQALQSHLQKISSAGIAVKAFQSALDEIIPQL